MKDTSSQPLRVFLCHSSGDKPAVRELYQKLNSEGWIDVWLDDVKLFPGQDWSMEIEKAVEESDIVIVCLSTRSVDKEGYVQRELRYVLNIADEKPEGSIFVIPLRLDDCVIPRRLRGWQWLNYFPEDQKQIAYQRLLGSLKLRASRLGISTDEPAVFRSVPVGIPQDKQAREKKIEKAGSTAQKKVAPEVNPLLIAGMITGGLLVLSLCILVAWSFLPNLFIPSPEPTDTFQPTATIATQPGQTNIAIATETFLPPTRPPILTGKDGMTLLYVPAGEFTMGIKAEDALAECQKFSSDCQLDWFTDEEPPHVVTLDAFWIDQTEVTNAMYAKCVQDGKCSQPSDTRRYDDPNYANHPVVWVSWNDAKAYCSWVGRRLPTEAEWEKAAIWNESADEKYVYPWGNVFHGTFLNFCDKNCQFNPADKSSDDGYAETAPAGSYPEGTSPYGVLDMAGNVWEWVSSIFTPYPYSATDGREDLSVSGDRVLRGGAWGNYITYVHSAYRGKSEDPSYTYRNIGFRCSRSP